MRREHHPKQQCEAAQGNQMTKREFVMRKRARNRTGSIRWTFEELGKSLGKSIEADIEFDIEPAEQRTWDHPGSPGGMFLTSVEVCKFTSDDYSKKEFGSWGEFIDQIAFGLAEKHWPEIEEAAGEDADGSGEAALEAYYNARREERFGC